jgi:hypothetical protein
MNSVPKAFTINAMDNLSLDCFIPSNLVNLDANYLFVANLIKVMLIIIFQNSKFYLVYIH